jgi:CRISPR-associated Csx2 family protein
MPCNQQESEMRTVLIGFIGRGPYSQDGKRRDYRPTRFEIEAWESSEVTFFLRAAYEWLIAKQVPPEKVVILGTSGSGWDELLLRFSELTGRPHDEQTDELWCELAPRVDDEAISEADLGKVQERLSTWLGIEVIAELIPKGKNKQEQASILDAMQRHVESRDRVYLDVTHGYRHQPMLALGAAYLISRLRNARIEEIFYGAAEMTEPGQAFATVVSLRWLVDLLEFAEVVQQFRTGGRLWELAHFVSDSQLQKGLSETAFLLSTNQLPKAGRSANRSRHALRDAKSDPLLDLMRTAIDQSLGQFIGSKRDALGTLATAEAALKEQDFVRVSILLCEGMRIIESRSGRKLKEKAREIRNLRNALAHAAKIDDPAVERAMASRKHMHETLRQQLDWLNLQQARITDSSGTFSDAQNPRNKTKSR